MSDDLKTRLLVVDDEQSIRRLCMTIGTALGFACTEAESAEAALPRLEADTLQVVPPSSPGQVQRKPGLRF